MLSESRAEQTDRRDPRPFHKRLRRDGPDQIQEIGGPAAFSIRKQIFTKRVLPKKGKKRTPKRRGQKCRLGKMAFQYRRGRILLNSDQRDLCSK